MVREAQILGAGTSTGTWNLAGIGLCLNKFCVSEEKNCTLSTITGATISTISTIEVWNCLCMLQPFTTAHCYTYLDK
jgi:hypothetical protein